MKARAPEQRGHLQSANNAGRLRPLISLPKIRLEPAITASILLSVVLVGVISMLVRKLARQADSSEVELSATFWRYSRGVNSPRELWGRSSLYSICQHQAASRTS
jgi:hypothetical protein